MTAQDTGGVVGRLRELLETELERARVMPSTPGLAVHAALSRVLDTLEPKKRECACHPDDRPAICQHRYAATECQASAEPKSDSRPVVDIREALHNIIALARPYMRDEAQMLGLRLAEESLAALTQPASDAGEMRKVLEKCLAQFRFYADEHDAKQAKFKEAGDFANADASSNKASVNRNFAATILAALSHPNAEGEDNA